MNPEVAFLVQMALILGMARLMGELMRRIGQPPVLGELIGGILLGPTLLGKFSPEIHHAIFSNHTALDHLSRAGLVLLMLLTGLETDIQVLRNLGRAAFMASLFGLIIPFGCGYLLGENLDARFISDERMRFPLSLFLATAMAVSAMPVIAKILLDLKMMKRNLGLVILSAAVVDDTIGWLILAGISSLLAGMNVTWFEKALRAAGETLGTLAPVKGGSVNLGMTVVWLLLFVIFARYILYPALRRFLPVADHFLRIPGGEMVVILVVAFGCAACTEALHVHAVFGAFLAGMVFRQCPTLSRENVHQLESVTMHFFAPLFFGSIGLRADFFQIQTLALPLIVCAVAASTKIIGCFIGGLLGKMPPWEALGIGLGMSARGSVGLIVAQIGLNMGILTPELFSILVLMTIVTTVLAPITMKAIAHKIPLSEEELLREKGGGGGGFIPNTPIRVLIPAGGGENALRGCHVATHLCSRDGDRCTALYVDKHRDSWGQRLFGSKAAGANPSQSARTFNSAEYLERLKKFSAAHVPLSIIKASAPAGVIETILEEAKKGYQFLFIGASGAAHPVHDPFVTEMVRNAPCHMVLACGGAHVPLPADGSAVFKKILVSTNGGFFSEAAFELAARYAESSGAHLTVLYVLEGQERNPLLPAVGVPAGNDPMQDVMRITLKEDFASRFKFPERIECHVRESETLISGLLEETRNENYDLAVVGVEKKMLVERLNLGQDIEQVVEEAPCALMLVIPKIG